MPEHGIFRFTLLAMHCSLLLAMDPVYAQVEPDSGEKAKTAEALILNGVSNSIGKNRLETRARLGQPIQTDIENRTNPYLPGVIDSIVSFRFKGARVRYFVPGKGNPSKEFVMEAEATSKALRFGQGISIGAKMNSVISTLGFPKIYSPDSLVYEDESLNNAILFFSKTGLIKVKWKFYWE